MMDSTANSSTREQWHGLFNAVLNGTLNENEHDQLADLLRSSAEARQLWFVYTDSEIGLGEIGLGEIGLGEIGRGKPDETSPQASPALKKNRFRSAIYCGFGCVVILVILAIWISTTADQPATREVAERADGSDVVTNESARPTNQRKTNESVIHENLIDEHGKGSGREENGMSLIKALPEAARPESLTKAESEARLPVSEAQLHRESKQELESAPSVMELSKSPARDWPRLSARAQTDLLYFVEKGQLIELNLSNDSRRRVGNAAWTKATAMDVMTSDTQGILDQTSAGLLFVIDQGRLFEVNLATGSHRRLGNRQWTDSDTIVAGDDSVFIFGADASYRIHISDGKLEQF